MVHADDIRGDVLFTLNIVRTDEKTVHAISIPTCTCKNCIMSAALILQDTAQKMCEDFDILPEEMSMRRGMLHGQRERTN